jgi:hypothetical protein
MKNRLLLLFASGALIFTNCKKEQHCPEPPRHNYPFAAADTAIFPYKGYETLRFVRNGRDTLNFFGKALQNSTYEDYKLGGDCTAWIDVYPQRYLYFTSPDTAQQMVVEIAMQDKVGILEIGLGLDYNEAIVNLAKHYAYDSLLINNHWYKNIFKIRSSDTNDTATYVLYTQNEGVVRVKTLKHEVWDII